MELLARVFVGLTRAREMKISMLLAVFLFFLPALLTVKWWGNHGLWFAFCLFMMARAAGLMVYLIYLDRKKAFC